MSAVTRSVGLVIWNAGHHTDGTPEHVGDWAHVVLKKRRGRADDWGGQVCSQRCCRPASRASIIGWVTCE